MARKSKKTLSPARFLSLNKTKIQQMGFVEVELPTTAETYLSTAGFSYQKETSQKAYANIETPPESEFHGHLDRTAFYFSRLMFSDGQQPDQPHVKVKLDQSAYAEIDSHTDYGKVLVQQGLTDVIDKEAAQALFMFACTTGSSWDQQGQYAFVDKLISTLVMEKALVPLGMSDEQAHKNKSTGSHFYVNRVDQDLKITVYGSFAIDGSPTLFHRSTFLMKAVEIEEEEAANSTQYTLTRQETKIYAKKAYMLKEQIEYFFSAENDHGSRRGASTHDTHMPTHRQHMAANQQGFKQSVIANPNSTLSDIRAITLNTPALPPHWMSRVFGALIGLVMGILTSPIIYTSLALEDMARNKPMHWLKRLVKLMLTVLLSPLAPLIGAAYGVESGFNTGLPHAISPKAHFKCWLSHSLKHRKGEARMNYWKAHKDHDPAYTVLTISVLLTGGVFAVLFLQVITPPIFVVLLEWLTLPVLPVSIALVGVGVILLLGAAVALYQHAHFQPEPDDAAQLETLKASNTANLPASPAEVKTPGAATPTVNTTGTPEPAQTPRLTATN